MRKVDIRVARNSWPCKMGFIMLKETLEDNVHKKALVHASSRAKINYFQSWCKSRVEVECTATNKLDKVYLLKVTGPLNVVQKLIIYPSLCLKE